MIQVDRLEKTYGGRAALGGISFHVAKGEVLGFLGPNGAGKTTTMKILTGLIPATAGKASVAGFDVHEQSLEVRRRIGYLPEQPPLYREMIVRDFLRFVGDLKGVPRGKKEAMVCRAMEQCGLTEVAGRIVGRLSKGYRQRVGLAQAVLPDPQVLSLDEPTVGLDPKQIVEIRSVIKGLGGERTVILSTHILPEVTMTCERVVIISKGLIVAEDSIENLTARTGKREKIIVTLARERDGMETLLSRIPGVVEARRAQAVRSWEIAMEGGPQGRERLAEAVVGTGCGLIEMKALSASLEDVFLELITEEHGVAA